MQGIEKMIETILNFLLEVLDKFQDRPNLLIFLIWLIFSFSLAAVLIVTNRSA